MKYVDRAIIQITAGHGGQGSIHFRREKYVPKGGPDGGNGGKGGDVIIKSTPRLQTLMDLNLKKKYRAENGNPGGGKNQTGADGNDLILDVPCGTMIFDDAGILLADLTTPNATWRAASGGKGGHGNAYFATSTNQTPRNAQPGIPGEIKTLHLELRLIADIGLIGLPNAGKSTLLKALTAANPKIAAYPFTTLYPNLGVLKFVDREIIIADIPGLIEGASEGHGLGFDFLRHIDRTRVILHLVSMESLDPNQCWKDYQTVRHELDQSPMPMSHKPYIVVLTKADIIEPQTADSIQAQFKSVNTVLISAVSHSGLTELTRQVMKLYEANAS